MISRVFSLLIQHAVQILSEASTRGGACDVGRIWLSFVPRYHSGASYAGSIVEVEYNEHVSEYFTVEKSKKQHACRSSLLGSICDCWLQLYSYIFSPGFSLLALIKITHMLDFSRVFGCFQSLRAESRGNWYITDTEIVCQGKIPIHEFIPVPSSTDLTGFSIVRRAKAGELSYTACFIHVPRYR